MWVFDLASLHVIDVKQAAVDFYGISKSIFLTLELGALLPDGSGAALFSPVRSAGTGGVALQICGQVKGDGSMVLVELATARMQWHDYKEMLVSLADVTQRHLSERALRRKNAELEQKLCSHGKTH